MIKRFIDHPRAAKVSRYTALIVYFFAFFITFTVSVSAMDPPLESGKCYTIDDVAYEIVVCPVPLATSPPGCTLVQRDGSGEPISVGAEKIDCQTGRALNGLLAPPLEDRKCYIQPGLELLFEIVVCPVPMAVSPPGCWLVPVDADGKPFSVGSKQMDCQTGITQGSDDETDTNNDGNALLEGDCKDGLTKDNCAIVGYLINTINALSALAGMAIIGSIMMAGYQYMTARDNSGQIEAAKKRIIWALVALGVFIFMYSLLNWLVPGGVL